MAAETVAKMSSAASSLCNFKGSRKQLPLSHKVTSQRRNRCYKVQSLNSEFFGSFRICSVTSLKLPKKNGFSVFAMAAAEGYTGNNYTWTNGRKGRDRVCKRLDRMLVNEDWQDVFENTPVIHKARIGSDHNLLLVKFASNNQNYIKYFKFLNCWSLHDDFSTFVQNNWNIPSQGNPMRILQMKLKRLAKDLGVWSKQQFGDVFYNYAQYEEMVRIQEGKMDEDPSDINIMELNKLNAEYIRWSSIQYNLLQQKTNIQWKNDGDKCTKYFFSIIKHKRNRTNVQRIKNSNGSWLENKEEVAEEAIKYFKDLFTDSIGIPDMGALNHIEEIITENDNLKLDSIPDEEEILQAIMELNPSSAPGPDGFNGFFYQKCWHIIKREVINFVHYFFNGNCLTKFFTHTCLVLIPKVEAPSSFSQMRPISLSNFTNKIISRLITTRISSLLPKIVSENQSGFLKNRLITDNVLLT